MNVSERNFQLHSIFCWRVNYSWKYAVEHVPSGYMDTNYTKRHFKNAKESFLFMKDCSKRKLWRFHPKDQNILYRRYVVTDRCYSPRMSHRLQTVYINHAKHIQLNVLYIINMDYYLTCNKLFPGYYIDK